MAETHTLYDVPYPQALREAEQQLLPEDRRSVGIAVRGGGIRSATFAAASWRVLVVATQAHATCAEQAYAAFQRNRSRRSHENTCQAPRVLVSAATERLAGALEKSREGRRPRGGANP